MTEPVERLSQDDLFVLTDGQKATVAKMEKFFDSEGWREVILPWIVQNLQLSEQRVLNAPDWDRFVEARQQKREFERWLNLEAAFFAEYRELAAAQSEEARVSVEERYE